MPSDTDLKPEAESESQNAESAQSHDKSKHFMDLSSNRQELELELELSANEKNCSMKTKKISNKTKRCIKQNDITCSPQLSAKHVICNTITTNGYIKPNNTYNTQPNRDNETKDDVVNGQEADDTDIEEQLDYSTADDHKEGTGLTDYLLFIEYKYLLSITKCNIFVLV